MEINKVNSSKYSDNERSSGKEIKEEMNKSELPSTKDRVSLGGGLKSAGFPKPDEMIEVAMNRISLDINEI